MHSTRFSSHYSCVLLFLSINHIEKGPGPKSTHARERDDAAKLAEAGMSNDAEKEEEEEVVPSRQPSVDESPEVPITTETASTPIGGR